MITTTAIGEVSDTFATLLKQTGISGVVACEWTLRGLRLMHSPSGIAKEYDDPEDRAAMGDIVVDFLTQLRSVVLRDELEAVELYQEPRLVRL